MFLKEKMIDYNNLPKSNKKRGQNDSLRGYFFLITPFLFSIKAQILSKY
jgi:hypothetical protein